MQKHKVLNAVGEASKISLFLFVEKQKQGFQSIFLIPLLVGFQCLDIVLLFNTLCPSSFLDGDERASLYLSSWCRVTVNVLWLFFTVSLFGLRCVIVVFPNHTHLFFYGCRWRSRSNVRLVAPLETPACPFKWAFAISTKIWCAGPFVQ